MPRHLDAEAPEPWRYRPRPKPEGGLGPSGEAEAIALMRRPSAVFRAKASNALDQAEDHGRLSTTPMSASSSCSSCSSRPPGVADVDLAQTHRLQAQQLRQA